MSVKGSARQNWTFPVQPFRSALMQFVIKMVVLGNTSKQNMGVGPKKALINTQKMVFSNCTKVCCTQKWVQK